MRPIATGEGPGLTSLLLRVAGAELLSGSGGGGGAGLGAGELRLTVTMGACGLRIVGYFLHLVRGGLLCSGLRDGALIGRALRPQTPSK